MSKIAIIGATGRAGSQLVDEAVRRGHQVTAIARHAAATLSGRPGVTPLDLDAQDADALTRALRGHDAVINATHFATTPVQSVTGPVKAAGVPRLLIVGGAGSLNAAPGLRVIDAPGFPDAFRQEAAAGAAFLDALRAEPSLDWTYVSPSAEFVEGPRTGQSRRGRDDLLVSAEGRSWITFADFAIALLDELEQPKHSRQRFTVGY